MHVTIDTFSLFLAEEIGNVGPTAQVPFGGNPFQGELAHESPECHEWGSGERGFIRAIRGQGKHEKSHGFGRPCRDLEGFWTANPPLKRWAIIGCPSGTLPERPATGRGRQNCHLHARAGALATPGEGSGTTEAGGLRRDNQGWRHNGRGAGHGWGRRSRFHLRQGFGGQGGDTADHHSALLGWGGRLPEIWLAA